MLPPDLESAGIGLLQAQWTFALTERIHQVAVPLLEVLTLGLDGFPHHRRVGGDEIAGRHGIGELACVELDLLGGLVVEAVDIAHGRLHPARGQ